MIHHPPSKPKAKREFAKKSTRRPRLSSQEKTRKLFTLGVPGSRHCGHESRRNGAARDCDNSPSAPLATKEPLAAWAVCACARIDIYIYLPREPRKPRKSLKTRDSNHFRGGGTPVPPPLRRLKTRINQRESSSRARARKKPQGKPSGGELSQKPRRGPKTPHPTRHTTPPPSVDPEASERPCRGNLLIDSYLKKPRPPSSSKPQLLTVCRKGKGKRLQV